MAAILVGILIHGSAMAQPPSGTLIEPEREVPPEERAGGGMEPVIRKFGRGFFNIVKAPADIPAAFVKRASGERPRHYGWAVLSSPLEGAGQGILRAWMGLLEAGLAPFPPYDVPFYEYDMGASVFDAAYGKLGFGMYNQARAVMPYPLPLPFIQDEEGGQVLPYEPPLPIPDAWIQAFMRAETGLYYELSWPFPPYSTEPPYPYEYGSSPVDGAIEGFLQGTENMVISPFEMPMTAYKATRDRGLIYGGAYGLVMGPTNMVVRAGAGMFETSTNLVAILYGMAFGWSPDFQGIEFDPVYDIELGESMPDMFLERPRLKQPVYQPIGQTQK
jgi:hypothetical protein